MATSIKRNLKPREPIAIHVATVSQITSEPALGIPGRRFLERIIPLCHGVAQVGNLRVVSIEEVRRVLATLEDEGEESVEPSREARQPEDADEVLAALGKRVARR